MKHPLAVLFLFGTMVGTIGALVVKAKLDSQIIASLQRESKISAAVIQEIMNRGVGSPWQLYVTTTSPSVIKNAVDSILASVEFTATSTPENCIFTQPEIIVDPFTRPAQATPTPKPFNFGRENTSVPTSSDSNTFQECLRREGWTFGEEMPWGICDEYK